MAQVISFPARRATAEIPDSASDLQEARYRVNFFRNRLAWWEAELAMLTMGAAANDRRA